MRVTFCFAFIDTLILLHQEMERSGCQAFDRKNLAETFKCQGNKLFVCLFHFVENYCFKCVTFTFTYYL